jgi:hypothetical protein
MAIKVDIGAEQRDHLRTVIGGDAERGALCQHQHEVLEKNEQAEGGEDLHHRLVQQWLDQQALHQQADDEHRRHHYEKRRIRVDAGPGVDEIGAVHADHQDFAVGEIGDADDPENERQADADQAVDAAKQQAVNQDRDDVVHSSACYWRCRDCSQQRAQGKEPGRAATCWAGSSATCPGSPRSSDRP